MPRSEYGRPPAAATTQAELAAVKEQLMEMDRKLRAEKLARSELSSRAKAEISNLRRELQNSTPAEPDADYVDPARRRSQTMLTIIAIALVAAVAGFSVWYVDPLHTWDGHPAAVSQAPEAAAKKTTAAPAPPMGSSAETHEFSRLNDAVRSIPATSRPVALNAANQWLDTNGQQACSVQSAQGDVSLVISGKGGDQPLLSALSRCATAVEHLAPPGNQKHP